MQSHRAGMLRRTGASTGQIFEIPRSFPPLRLTCVGRTVRVCSRPAGMRFPILRSSTGKRPERTSATYTSERPSWCYLRPQRAPLGTSAAQTRSSWTCGQGAFWVSPYGPLRLFAASLVSGYRRATGTRQRGARHAGHGEKEDFHVSVRIWASRCRVTTSEAERFTASRCPGELLLACQAGHVLRAVRESIVLRPGLCAGMRLSVSLL